MSNGRRLTLAFATFASVASAGAFASHPAAHILHHESIAVTAHKSGMTERVTFEALGKRFDITLEPNERVRRALKATATVVPLRGSIDGIAHSWARLTRSADGHWQGLLSDGHEIYAIEPAGDVRSMAVEPLTENDATAVIYRLSDLLVEWAPGFCEALPPGEQVSALEAFKAIGAEVVPSELASGGPAKQISIGVVGDYEFNSYFTTPTSTPTQAVIARMNNVDGIFSDQVGVNIEVPTIKLFTTSDDPFTQSDAKQLLDQVHLYRKNTSEQASRGITHLMTGHDLSGETVGIAYIGTVCEGEYAVSLSEGTRSTTMSSLIAAHEIGHNFNAPHDGDSAGACASTPTTYLMAAQINYSNQFSACSLQEMQLTIATAQCLTAYSPPDAAVEVAAVTVQGIVNNALTVQFDVRSMGSSSSQNVLVTATLPSGLTLNSSAADGTTCTTGAGSVSCILGEIPADTRRFVTLNLLAQTAGTYPIDLSIDSSNDGNPSNNAGHIDVAIAATAPNPSSPVSASSGGGGGSISFAMLSALLSFSLWQALRRPASSGTQLR